MNNFTFLAPSLKKIAIVFSLLFIVNIYRAYAQFTPGDLIVYRVDNGSSSLNTADAVNVYLDEYTTTGTGQTPVVSVALPATPTTAGLTESGKATSDALMRLSTNDQYLVFPGYLATLGTTGIVTSSNTTNPRLIGRINSGETVSIATEITDGYNNNNIRSACSDYGSEFWTGGNDAGSGTRYVAALGNTTSTAISTTEPSTNGIFIIDGQLYTYVKGNGLYTVGTGLPITSGQSMTLLSSTNSGAGEDFVMFNVNGSSTPELLYIADQTNGIYKYTSTDGTTWTQVGTYLAITGGVDGITGYVDCNGNAQLFFTDNPGLEGNNLWSVADVNAYASGTAISGTATMLATASSTAPHQSGFRGVAFAPIASYPTVSITPSSPTICISGSGITLTASEVVGSTAVNGVTYTWSPSAGLAATTGSAVAATPTVTTTYTVEATTPYPNSSSSPVTGEGCVSGTVVVSVTQLPIVNAGNAPDTLCSDSTYSVANAFVANYSSFSWSSSSSCATCFSDTTALDPVYTLNATDISNGAVTITLNVRGNSPCGNTEDSRTITISKAPIANSGNNTSTALCPGSAYTVTNASAANSTSFSWASSSGCSACFSSTTALNPVYTPSSTDITNSTVTITLTAIGNSVCGNDTSSKTITIDTGAHPVTVLPLSPTVCPGESVSLYVAGVVGSFTWSPTAGLNKTSGDTVVATPTVPTLYSVSGMDSLGCKSTGTDSVLIGPAPPFSVTPLSAVVCNGLSTIFNVSSEGTGFTWTPSIGLNTSIGDSVTASPTINVTYTVTGTDSLGCIATGSATVSLIPSPNKPSFHQHGDTLISSSEHDNQWYRNDSLLIDDTSQYLIITVLGNYFVSVVNEVNGCSTPSDTVLIDSLSGIKQLMANSGLLTVYPNPVSNQLIIISHQSSIQKIEMDNLLGETMLVYAPQYYKAATAIILDVSRLAAGMYFVTVTSDEKITTVKVIVAK